MSKNQLPIKKLNQYINQFKRYNRTLNKNFKFINKKVATTLSVAVVVAIIGADYYSNRPIATNDLPAYPQGEYSLSGRITHVADGDTLNIQVNGQRERVRLANIDAPESEGRADRPGQPYAEESTQALAALVLNTNTSLHCFEKDHYGRHVCNIPLADGDTANRVLVEKGLAWAYTGSNERYLRDQSLKQVQAQAQRAGVGLWQQKNPIAPWVWRVQCWQKKQCG